MYNLSWTPGITLDQLERQAIEQAFKFYHANKSQTARSLGIAIRTLETKLEKYAADDERTTHANDAQRAQRDEHLRRARGIHTEQSTLDAANGAASGSGRDVRSGEPYYPEKAKTGGNSAAAGVRMEPVANAAEKQSVPVSVGQKVQGVLPAQAAASHSRKAR